MTLFDTENRRDHLNELMWIEIAGFVLFACLGITADSSAAFMAELGANTVVFAETIMVMIITGGLILASLILAIAGREHEIKLAAPSAVMAGYGLLLIYPFVVRGTGITREFFCLFGVAFLNAGWILTTQKGKLRFVSLVSLILAPLPGLFHFYRFGQIIAVMSTLSAAAFYLFYNTSEVNKKTDINNSDLYIKERKLIFIIGTVTVVILSVLPVISQFGLFIPLFACLVMFVYMDYKQQEAIEKQLHTLRLQKMKKTEDARKLEADTKKNETANADKTAAAAGENGNDPSVPGNDTRNTGKSDERSSGNDLTAGSGFSIGRMLLDTLPKDGVWIYLIDKEDQKAYRYLPAKDELVECGENTEPRLRELVPQEYQEQFKTFLSGNGSRQIEIPIWNKRRSCYRDALVTATPLGNEKNADLVFGYDVTTSNQIGKSKEERLKDQISELKQQIAQNEDEAHRVFLSTNEMLYDIIEKKSQESKQHLRHVSLYVDILLHHMMKLYPEIGLTEENISEICEASLLHDIGKIEVPDEILNKKEQLTPEEYEIMKKHTVYGAEIINKMPYVQSYENVMKFALEMALHHHERDDGSGYPDGLKGREILPFVQAMSVADAYEAITTNRVYKSGVSHEEACRLIEAGKCGKFSDEMMNVFKDAQKDLQDAHYQIETRV